MRHYTPDELKETIRLHALWLADADGGTRANLTDANLSRANLSRAYLSRADLSDADLSGTCIDPSAPIPLISDVTLADAGLRIDGDTVHGFRTTTSQRNGNTVYAPGTHHVAPVFSVADTPCHPGIYLAGSAWLAEYYSNVPTVPCHCLRSELHHAGDKFRAKQLWIEV